MSLSPTSAELIGGGPAWDEVYLSDVNPQMEPIPYQKNLQSSVKNQPVPMDDVEFDQLVGMIKDSMSESVD